MNPKTEQQPTGNKDTNRSFAPSAGIIILNVVTFSSIAFVILVNHLAAGEGEGAVWTLALFPLAIVLWIVWLVTFLVDIRYLFGLAGDYTGVHIKISRSTKILIIALALAVLVWLLIRPNLPK